jgi:hypothetical protein
MLGFGGSSNATAQRQPDRVIDLSSWNAVRDQMGDSLPALLHRLPSADEARGTIVSGAQQAIDRARETFGSAMDAAPSGLQQKLPGRKKSGRSPWLTVAIVLFVAGGALFLYRKFTAQPDEDWMTEAWPAEPAPASASFQQQPESDAQSEKDAEESAEVYLESTPSANANP